jgi:hypothetical protein
LHGSTRHEPALGHREGLRRVAQGSQVIARGHRMGGTLGWNLSVHGHQYLARDGCCFDLQQV